MPMESHSEMGPRTGAQASLQHLCRRILFGFSGFMSSKVADVSNVGLSFERLAFRRGQHGVNALDSCV